jgi:MoaA/NifB/PqqE/SkfB family radical SAM enzyme
LKKAGINNINISLDSINKSVHDQLRGFEGAFEKASQALRLCVKQKIPCVLSTYASKRAVRSGDLKELISFAKQSGVTAVKILFPLMSGSWRHSADELLSDNEKMEVYNLLEPGFVYLESPLFSMTNGKKVCEALNRKMIYISPHGDVQICYTVPISFGNVKNERLKDILARMWESDLFNSIDNSHDCIMNNPHFREKYLKVFDDSEGKTVEYGDLCR